ncbi:predicted protein [Streptomyces viridosporus ATCC 14672]|uniref:Predicted protein n=1 Tax=Streptomyces viridosporus (strain ATCC 14672 / DSM 40746 / JCM 4963 / KCTC 9882 / NRRL B-12104 / FH 1290) TaxID=566461 RepID=D5ZXA4_STRV1|nr:predicted protein [Streptomyces viridosporus ATCC 14672]
MASRQIASEPVKTPLVLGVLTKALASCPTASHPKEVSFSVSNVHPLDDTPHRHLGFHLSPHRSLSTGTP